MLRDLTMVPPKTSYSLSLACLLISGALVAPTSGSQASLAPFNVTQPSTGQNITLYIQGGERFHWVSDGQGIDAFTVVRDGNGSFVYAKLLDDGNIGPTSFQVGEDDPVEAGIPRNVLPTEAARKAVCEALEHRCSKNESIFSNPTRNRSLQQRKLVEGKVKNLVVLMRWLDHLDRTVPTEEDIEILMNHEGPHELAPTGSVRDVYLTNSYGKLDLTSTVYKWITMDRTELYYADGSSGLTVKIQQAIRYALDQLEADKSFDFGQFDQDGDGYIDAIAFLHSGYGAEWGGTDVDGAYYEDRIWSHKWSIFGEWQSASTGVKVFDYHISPSLWGLVGSRIGRIGVIAHETGHFFGLPDLYDGAGFGQGIGSWCLMSNSWGFDQSQLYPPHLSAWTRLFLGWNTETVISKPGNYVISASESLESDFPQVYKITAGFPSGEYLLVENRQALYYDELIPQGGLAVWHIDEAQQTGQDKQGFPGMPGQTPWPENGFHYAYALLPAGGSYNLEKGRTSGAQFYMYHADGIDSIGPSNDAASGPFPNTDAYMSGNVFQTGNRLYNISTSNLTMTFEYYGEGGGGSGGFAVAVMPMFTFFVAVVIVELCR